MSTVNTGWLKDNNGEKFAPKTTSTQVVMNDGSNLDSKIQDIKTKAAYINAANNEDVEFDPNGGGNGGGVQIIDKTYEEYQALSDAEKMRDDVIYNITDRDSGVTFGDDDISGIGDGTVTGAIAAVDSKAKSMGSVRISISGLSINSSDAGWYYRDLYIKDKLPSGAVPFGLSFGDGFDACVSADLIRGGQYIVLRSASQFTVPSSREIIVYYFV